MADNKQPLLPPELVVALFLAFLQLALQMTFHGNYGYFRDELYYIACSDHLAFGYVDQPPLSIAILKISRLVLGDSLHALRFLPAVAGSVVVYLSALMARELGGSKFAMGLAPFAVVAAHTLIGHGRFFTMNAFDVLFWTLAGYIVIIIINRNLPKLWTLFGVVVGLGLMNKYSMGFMVIGIVAGLLFTNHRSQLATRWFWLGAAVAFVMFLPHIIWQVVNQFPSLEFMRNATENKNVGLSPLDFLLGQIRDINILNAPLWIGGVYFFFKHNDGRFRPFGWMYIVVFLVMVTVNAKVYYLSAIYPMFLAGGALLFEQFVQKKSVRWLKPLYAGLLLVIALGALPFTLPVLPVDKFIQYQKTLGLEPRAEERTAVGELPQYYADQFGWEEMVDSIAIAYKKLTPEEQAQCYIYVRNYGEAGAVDFFGKRHELPKAQSGHNSYWHWGPGEQTGDIAIIIGNHYTLEENLADLLGVYHYVELATVTNAKYCMPYENGRMIFICKGMKTTFQKLWPGERFYI